MRLAVISSGKFRISANFNAFKIDNILSKYLIVQNLYFRSAVKKIIRKSEDVMSLKLQDDMIKV